MNLYDLATSMAPNLITYKVCEGGMERFRTGGPKGIERGTWNESNKKNEWDDWDWDKTNKTWIETALRTTPEIPIQETPAE